jgi:hypothetical protein
MVSAPLTNPHLVINGNQEPNLTNYYESTEGGKRSSPVTKRGNYMDDKIFNMSEAFIKMTGSFLRLARAVKDAKFTIDNMLRLQYRAAGCPFGESEEGLLLWRDKLSKDFALLHEGAALSEIPGKSSGADQDEILYLSEHFSLLKDEVNTRIN